MEKKIRKEIKYSSDEWSKVIELSAKSGKLPAAYIRDKALNIKISVIDYLNHHPRDKDERFRLSDKMNDIAKKIPKRQYTGKMWKKRKGLSTIWANLSVTG